MKLRICILFLAIGCLSPSAAKTNLPNVAGQRLSDKADVTLLELAGDRPGLVLLAFSKNSGKRVRNLAIALREHYSDDRLSLVSVAVIAGVPSMFRGMARGSLRKDIPPEIHGQALLVVEDEQEARLRRALAVDDDDAAYAVALDSMQEPVGVVAVRGADDHRQVRELVERILTPAEPAPAAASARTSAQIGRTR